MFLGTSHKLKCLSISALLLLLIIMGCNKFPNDPERSFEKASGTALAVGFSPVPPWVVEENGKAGGIEGELVKNFADSKGFKIVWYEDSEHVLMKKLEDKELHIVIAGLSKDTPWKKQKIGLTMPYYKNKREKRVMAIQQGENRLLMYLEQYLFNVKDSIKSSVDAAKQEF